MQLTQSDPALRKKVGPEGFLEGEEEQDEGDLDSARGGRPCAAFCRQTMQRPTPVSMRQLHRSSREKLTLPSRPAPDQANAAYLLKPHQQPDRPSCSDHM